MIRKGHYIEKEGILVLIDEDEDDEEEDDECANADEGIERDCHEDGDHGSSTQSSSSASSEVNFDQVLQVGIGFYDYLLPLY